MIKTFEFIPLKGRFNLFFTLLFSLTLVGFFSGCVKTPRPKALVIWVNYNEEELHLFKEIALRWSNITHFEVQVKRIPWGGHEAKIRSSLTVHANPDIARVDCGFVQELARFNAVEPLDDHGFDLLLPRLNRAGLLSNRVGEHYYGLPDQITCLALFYNKKILKEALVSLPSEGLNLEEFADLLKKVTNPAKGIYGLALEKPLWFHLPWFYLFGADLLDKTNKKFQLHSPGGVSAMQFLVRLYQTDKTEAGSWQSGSISPEIGFLNQKYAFILSGPWNLKKFNEAPGLDYGVTPFPKGINGTATNIGGTNMVIFKRSPYKKEASDFLKYFLSEEIQKEWCEKLSQIPVNESVYSSLKFEKFPLLKVFLKQIKSARPRPQVMEFGKLCEIVEPEFEAMMKGSKTIEAALLDAERNFRKKIGTPK